MQGLMSDGTFPKLCIDMDGTLAQWKTVETTEMLYEKGFYLALEPNRSLIDATKDAHEEGMEIWIVSHYLSDSTYALEEKERWNDMHIPEIHNRLYVPYGISKSEFVCDHFGIRHLDSSFVLIDDYSKNLFEWRLRGGKAIKYLNAINGRGIKWKGQRIGEADLVRGLAGAV